MVAVGYYNLCEGIEMKALYICRHTAFRGHFQRLVLRLNRRMALLEAKDSAAGHEFIDAHPGLSLVIIGLNSAERDEIKALQTLGVRNGGQPIVRVAANDCVGNGGPDITIEHKLGDSPAVIAEHLTRSRSDSTDPPRVPGATKPGRNYSLAHTAASRDDTDGEFQLTPRQDEVLSLLRRGLSNKGIARVLDLAESTVKFHCMAIYRQLGVSNRTQAAVRAEELIANGYQEDDGHCHKAKAAR